MIRFPAIVMILAATALPSSAASRFALVKVTEIYKDLPSTVAFQQEIKAEHDGIMKDQRAEDLRKILAELQSIQAKLSDKTDPPDDAINRKLARTYEIKRQEAQTLQKEFEDFKAEREKEINRKMVSAMRVSLNRIMETAKRISKEGGYQCVFDSDGSTNTGVPFILYSKTPSVDITADVKVALQDLAAAATPAPAAPVPAPQKPATPSPKPTTPAPRPATPPKP